MRNSHTVDHRSADLGGNAATTSVACLLGTLTLPLLALTLSL